MAKVPVRKIDIAAGQTFVDSAVWCQSPYTFKTIASATRAWPTVLGVTAHGIPEGVKVPVWVSNSRGMSLDTTESAPWIAEYVDANSLTLVGVNTGDQAAYVANSATLAYLPPRTLTGFTARTQFRRQVTGPVLVECVSTGADPEFVLATAIGKITLTLTPAQTRALLAGGTSQTTGIAHVELVDGDGLVYRPWDYAWTCSPEGTRES